MYHWLAIVSIDGIRRLRSAVLIDLSENGMREIPRGTFDVELAAPTMWLTGDVVVNWSLKILDLSCNCLQDIG